ncbi:uncharacterized protein Tco025E_06889 [Trypanosoma conorhini]|uniref:Uncharacterized protein n=1 Tax=Trypanosoma conorhini TaxID=83891 RepID=A0A422NWW7_9TRYP|nr:uncharacterized protein Tco025E_06889 [Trypanosoma conorhini]RNF09936.1 hypothetical protein Tco025E_06889 [Trypanosoma conorhini]
MLQQEESDSALARQLHEEINGPGLSQPAAGSIPNETSAAKSIACPACTFVNVFTDILPGRSYTCKQCLTVLPDPTPNETWNASNSKQEMVLCAACRCLNRIPLGKFDAIVCGTCCHELKSKKPASEVQPPQTVPASTRPIQVRCGECSSINALQVGRDVTNVRFECGSCQTVNEVSL